jgi:hypothetical protein
MKPVGHHSAELLNVKAGGTYIALKGSNQRFSNCWGAVGPLGGGGELIV